MLFISDKQTLYKLAVFDMFIFLIEHKKTMTYGVGNPGPSLRQTQNCGGVKSIKCYGFLFNHVY
jgi:hypothetical protein